MISDFQILGIEETGDLSLIKSAFRRRAKELHPDLSTEADALERHDLFTAVCKAYRRLLAAHSEEASARAGDSGSAGAEAEAPKPNRPGLGLQVHADQAYAFYKQGMRHFMRIHPSRWLAEEPDGPAASFPESERELEDTRRKVAELVKLFPRAYYYFSIVANEFPDSEWAWDAREKMGKIEERVKRYRRIIESFSAWSAGERLSIKEYQARYRREEEARRAVRRDEASGWLKGDSGPG